MPAAFNNIVGLKPTCGWLSTSGVVPACRSIDCVSIFALTSDDAARIASVAGAYDRTDPYSRRSPLETGTLAAFRFGVPRAAQLEFFGDAEYARLFNDAVQRLETLGGVRVEIDFAPFRAAAKLLYEAAWIAERYVAVPDPVSSPTSRFIPFHSHGTGHAVAAGPMDGPTYERWVAGYDVATGQAKGRLRDDDHALRFIEVVVNGKRAKTVDIHAHCAVPEALALMNQKLGGPGLRPDLDMAAGEEMRCARSRR